MQKLAPAALVLALSACAPVHDVEVAWTIMGVEPSEDACGSAVESVKVTAFSSAERGGERTESTATFGCADGSGVLQVGNFADVKVELLRGEAVVGGADLFEVSPSSGFLTEPYAVSVDTHVDVGILTATLDIAGTSCGDAGVSSFAVELRREVTGLDTESVDTATVDCDGDATYTFDGVRVSSTYLLIAQAQKGDMAYATGGSGARILISRPTQSVVVSLIRERETADPVTE